MKRTETTLLLALLLLFSVACSKQSASPTWQEQYDLGVHYLSEGNYQEAIIAFTAAIEIDPKHAVTYVGRGEAYIGLGETDENLAAAQMDYEKAIELDDTTVAAYLGLADVHIRCGDFEKALEILNAALERTENDQRIVEKIAEMESGNITDSSGKVRRMSTYEATGDSSLQEQYDLLPTEQIPEKYIKITSVVYDFDSIGDVNGTPAEIEVFYKVPEAGRYAISLSIRAEGYQQATLIEDWEVSGSGKETFSVNLLLFDDNNKNFEILADLYEYGTSEAEWDCAQVCNDYYVISEGYAGVDVPSPQKFQYALYESGETVLQNVTVSGTIVESRNVDSYMKYIMCYYQYRSYYREIDPEYWDLFHGWDSYLFVPDSPLTVNGEPVPYLCISMALEFWSVSEENENYINNHVGQHMTIVGNIDDAGPDAGIVLKSSHLEPEKFVYCIEVPYTFVITAVK